MSECTWHCQLYPARLDRPGAGWQMQSSFTPAQHDVQPNLYFTCRIILALRKWSCESWNSSLFLLPSSDFTGAENGRPSVIWPLESSYPVLQPLWGYAPCLLCSGPRAHLLWQEVKALLEVITWLGVFSKLYTREENSAAWIQNVLLGALLVLVIDAKSWVKSVFTATGLALMRCLCLEANWLCLCQCNLLSVSGFPL